MPKKQNEARERASQKDIPIQNYKKQLWDESHQEWQKAKGEWAVEKTRRSPRKSKKTYQFKIIKRHHLPDVNWVVITICFLFESRKAKNEWAVVGVGNTVRTPSWEHQFGQSYCLIGFISFDGIKNKHVYGLLPIETAPVIITPVALCFWPLIQI